MEIEKVNDWVSIIRGISEKDLFEPWYAYQIQMLMRDNLVFLIDVNCNYNEQEYLDFCRHFGETQIQYPFQVEIMKIGDDSKLNIDSNTEFLWHNDGAHTKELWDWTILLGKGISKISGATYLCNMQKAYEDLEPDFAKFLESFPPIEHSLKNILKKNAKFPYEFKNEREKKKWVRLLREKHKLVQTTKGKKHLYFSDYVDLGEPFQKILEDHCFQEKYIFRQKWRPGQIVFFHNKLTTHKRDGSECKESRLWRAAINEY